MVFNTGAALLDAVVLAVVSREEEGTYGYKITQDVREVLEVSESTLYPVLRRLKKDGNNIPREYLEFSKEEREYEPGGVLKEIVFFTKRSSRRRN